MEAKSVKAVRSETQLLSHAFFDDTPKINVEFKLTKQQPMQNGLQTALHSYMHIGSIYNCQTISKHIYIEYVYHLSIGVCFPTGGSCRAWVCQPNTSTAVSPPHWEAKLYKKRKKQIAPVLKWLFCKKACLSLHASVAGSRKCGNQCLKMVPRPLAAP